MHTLTLSGKQPMANTRLIMGLLPDAGIIGRHRPKTGELGHFQLDTWQDFASTLLMF